jgi:opacity protein-like surface antigen
LAFSNASRAAVLFAAVALLAVPVRTAAQESDIVAPQRPASVIDLTNGVTFEVSPHTGVMGGSGIFGIRALMNYGNFTLELAGEQVIGKTANLYPVSVNMLLNLSTRGRIIPYGAVGAGLWLTVPSTTVGDRTVTSLGLNFGGGARYYVTKAFGFRLEAKQYMTSISSQRESSSELMFFQEVTLGVTFMFR